MTVTSETDKQCDRAEITINRAVNCGWITVHNREQLKTTIRIALDTEVEAGGPVLVIAKPS